MQKIIVIKIDLHRNGKLIPAIDLGPSGQAGGQPVNSLAGPECDEIFLIEQGRARADKAHVSSKDTEKLRQLIQAGCPEDSADPGNVPVRILKKMGGHGRSIGTHCPEFRHLENPVVLSYPL